MENVWYALLLAVHNLAQVIMAGGLFWLLLLQRQRQPAGPTNGGFEHVLATASLVNPMLYLNLLVLLAVSGGGLTFVHILYHGRIRAQTLVSFSAFMLKMILVGLLAWVLMLWRVRVAAPLARDPASANLQGLLAARDRYVAAATILSGGILLVTPFVTYFQAE